MGTYAPILNKRNKTYENKLKYNTYYTTSQAPPAQAA